VSARRNPRNPVARALRSPHLRPRVKRSGKLYRRRVRGRAEGFASPPCAAGILSIKVSEAAAAAGGERQ
jgi:hypothetical protein